MKAIILARVSSKEQEDNNSIPAQTRRLLDYCQRKNLEVVDIKQLVESSTKSNRRQFSEIIHRIRTSRETVALVTDTIDRLQRSFKESVQLDELRKINKVELHFVRENLLISEKSNSADILRWDMGVLFAKSYVTQLTDNIKRSQEEKVRNGEWLSKAPFGYTNTRRNGKAWIEPDSNAVVVTQMFNRYASGVFSLRDIKKWLYDTYNINKVVGQVAHILENPFYSGFMLLKGQRIKHCYESIISQEIFDEVQNIKRKATTTSFKFAGYPYLYRGLITCSECGCRITPDRSKGHIYYHCTQYKGKHGAKYIPEHILTAQFQEILGRIHPSDEQYKQVIDVLRKSHEDNERTRQRMMSHFGAELEKVKNRSERLFDIYLDGEITKEEYKSKRNAYNAKKYSLENKLDSIDTSIDEWHSNSLAVMELVRNAPLLFTESSEVTQKRQIIKLLFQNLELDGNKLRYKLRKPFDSIVKIKGCLSWCWK